MPSSSKKSGSTTKAKTGVQLSNADKLLWPKAKISKQDLLDHYELVWPRMEPFVINRPLSLLRAPDGVDGQRFFQKHASPGMHEAIATLRDPQDKQEHLTSAISTDWRPWFNWAWSNPYLGSEGRCNRNADQVVLILTPMRVFQPIRCVPLRLK